MRKNNEKLLAVLLVMMLMCSLVTGCGSSLSDTTEAAVQESYDGEYGFDSYGDQANYEEESYSMETKSATANDVDGVETDETVEKQASTEAGSANAKSNSSQKIIKRYDYNYETEHFDDAYAFLKKQIETYGGYISSSEINDGGYSSDYRTLYMTARIPAEDSEKFVSELGQLGTVVRQSESAEDVTLQYSDTESRIEALEIEQERLNALLEQADSLETIIALEDRLTEVRYELESYQSKKKLYDNLISYSTVDITLEEVNYTVETDDGTFFSRIVTGLERSLRDIAAGFVGFVEWFVINLPYFIVWGVIIFIIVKVVRAICKKNKAKRMKKQQMRAEQLQKEQQMRAEQMQKEQQIKQSTIQGEQPNVDVVASDGKTK